MTSDNKSESSGEQSHRIQEVRHEIADAILVLSGLIGFVSLGLTILNGLELGWQVEITGLVLVVLCITSFAVFRKYLSYHIKTTTIITLAYAIGLLNFLGWGLIGTGTTAFVLVVLLSMIFYDTRYGLLSYGVIIVSMAGITIAVKSGWLIFNVNFELYAYSDSAWIERALMIALISALLIASLGRIITVLEEQLEKFRQHSDELTELTGELVTEMKKRGEVEMTLAQVIDNLKDLDHLKDNFIDSVSHELRTPISNIQLYHQLLAMNPAKKDEYFDTLKKETTRLSYIVEQLIQASSDHYDMELTTMLDIDLKSLVVALFKPHKEMLVEGQISLTLPATDEGFITLAAPEHIDRVLGNLVDNALKYTPPDGSIIVKLQRDDSSEPRTVGVSIQNTGDCLTEYERKTIFDRFVRGESSLKQGIPGAGLGLSIARQIVEKYGGRIDFRCDETSGMLIFTMWLPSIMPIAEFLASKSPLPAPSI